MKTIVTKTFTFRPAFLTFIKWVGVPSIVFNVLDVLLKISDYLTGISPNFVLLLFPISICYSVAMLAGIWLGFGVLGTAVAENEWRDLTK